MVEQEAFMYKEYFQSSAAKLKSTRYLALMAIFIAIKIILASYYIPVSENLRISIRFIPVAIEALIFGPAAGMLSGAVTDILGFLLFPNGPFFPGYTLSAVIQSAIYAFFLYRRQVTVLRISGAQILNNYIVNVTLGSLWSMFLYSKGYWYYLVKSLIKNTILLPAEILVLVILLNLFLPFLVKKNLAVRQDSSRIKLF